MNEQEPTKTPQVSQFEFTDQLGARTPDQWAEDDAKLFGIGFVIEGIGRVDPSRVKIFYPPKPADDA